MNSNQRWHLAEIAAVAAGLVMIACVTVQATPIFKFWPEYEYSQDEDFETTYTTLLDDPLATQATDYHVFSLWMEVTGAADSPDESFWAAQLDIDLGPGFTAATFEGAGLYHGGYLMVDPPGPTPNGSLFSSNTDAGDDPTDLKRITIITNANSAYAHAADPGETGPFKLGEFWLNFDWQNVNGQSYVGVKQNVVGDSVGMWVGSSSVIMPNESLLFGQVNVFVVPEPASIALAGVALVGLVALARRRG